MPHMYIERHFVAVHVPVVPQTVHARAVSNAPIPHASDVGQYVQAQVCRSETGSSQASACLKNIPNEPYCWLYVGKQPYHT